MLQSFSYLLHNFETWSKRKKESEAEKVARINELLTIVFNDSCLVTKTGETVGKSTHETYFLNEHNFSGGNSSNYNTSLVSAPSVSPSSPSFSSHIGRKIDLVVCNDQDAELAFCEFKSTNKKHLIQSQASKNLRLNQTIKINMWKMFVDEPIVFFNWEGRFGEFHSMQETSEIFVSQRKEAIVIPTSQKTLDDKFATTFIAFLKWKAHLLDVEQKIAKALISPDRREYEYPATCFTVVNNKKRKTSA
ncbi:hypothetical protein EDC96DRAFT_110948 [Choanephora cucurbitarum]|nr:hypothetical protein EDC96DRAFT_110948 [Choanephora cucurbitarum]